MVATTFAADTPLVVTGMVARYGIAGNWLWWNMAASGMLTVFVYARLWRRAGVMTDVEFAELRYSGKPAAFLRGFRALYLGIPINCIIIGWVNLAMMKILQVTLGLDAAAALWALVAMLAFTAFYTTICGLVGRARHRPRAVRVEDGHGRRAGVLRRARDRRSRRAPGKSARARRRRGRRLAAHVFPVDRLGVDAGDHACSSISASAGGRAGIRAPSRAAAATSRSASSRRRTSATGLFATLWFNIAHYAVRPWPWILTALASLVLYPTLVDKESGYVRTLMDPNVFPPALRGIMLAAFAAAYMSTIGTQLNWGASYVVNDFYRRFVRRGGAEREYVIVSQAVTVGLMLVSIYVTLHLASIEQAWKLLIVTGAGTGTVLLLRWFWWRINAWSEVSAMAVAAVVSLYLQLVLKWDSDRPRDFAYIMIVTVSLTTIAWLAVTWMTAPEPAETLHAFYRRVRPHGPGWAPIAAASGLPAAAGSLGRELLNALLGCVLVYAALFGVGEILLRSAAPRRDGPARRLRARGVCHCAQPRL